MRKFLKKLFDRKWIFGDLAIWMIFFLLSSVSLVEVFSASSRLMLINASSTYWTPLISHALFLIAGFFIIVFVHRVPVRAWMAFQILFMLGSFALLTYASFCMKTTINGTHRWVPIAGILVQPSEFAKIALIMSVSVILAKAQTSVKRIRKGKVTVVSGAFKGNPPYKPFMLVGVFTVVICGLIAMEDVSTSAMLFMVILALVLVARVPFKYVWRGLAGLAVAGCIVVAFCVQFPEQTKDGPLKRVPTVVGRIQRALEPETDTVTIKAIESVLDSARVSDIKMAVAATGQNAMDFIKDSVEISRIEQKKDAITTAELLSKKKAQTTYACVAISNSEFWGLGPGNSIEREFLQHAESDFIYAIIIEELGVEGAIVILMLYLWFMLRVGRIAMASDRYFTSYLVLGLGLSLTIQAMVNMMVAVGAMPVTGQTLPLISKGGTSVFATCFCYGIILSASRENMYNKLHPNVDGEKAE